MIKTVIIKPLLTEKATQMTTRNVYTFQVGDNASKYQIKQALEDSYKVKVAKIRIVTKAGKTRRAGKRMQTKKTPDRKVAYVKLKEGSIDLFPKA